MNAQGGEGRLDSAVPASGGRVRAVLSAVLTAATVTVLLVLGAVAGLNASLSAGWLTRYWDAGQPVPLLSVLALLAFLALLYWFCRLLAWGGRGPAAAAFAVGYVLALAAVVGYLPGGDILMSVHIMDYGYLFGSMLVLVLGVVHGLTSRGPGRGRP